MHYFLFLPFALLLLQILNVLGNLKCESQKKFDNFNGQQFGTITSELREFVCDLEKHNSLLKQAFPPASPPFELDFGKIKTWQNDAQKTNEKGCQKKKKTAEHIEFLKKKWNLIRQNDSRIAECFESLRNSIYEVTIYGESIHEKLKRRIIKAVFILANRMEIPYQMLITKIENKNKSKKLKELAKLWAQMNLGNIYEDEENEKEKGENEGGKKGERERKGRREKRRKSEKEKAKKILKLILSTINDGNIMALNKLTTKGDRLPKRRRRKKRQFPLAIVGVLVAMAVLVIILYFVCSGQCSYSSGEKYADIDGDIEAGTAHGPHRPSEIRVKFRYGSEDRDREGNRKTDHVYIVVGKYEYDYTTGGARARNKNWRKNFPTKTFSFTPRLHVDGDLKRVSQILERMKNGKWSNGSLDSFRLCLDFAYQFVCLLRNGECPPKEQWPETFTDFDRRWVRKVNGRLSVYDKRYRNSAQNSELSRDTTEVANEMPETASATVPTWLTMVEEDEYPWTLAGYFEDEWA